jgi:hypothetical protein
VLVNWHIRKGHSWFLCLIECNKFIEELCSQGTWGLPHSVVGSCALYFPCFAQGQCTQFEWHCSGSLLGVLVKSVGHVAKVIKMDVGLCSPSCSWLTKKSAPRCWCQALGSYFVSISLYLDTDWVLWEFSNQFPSKDLTSLLGTQRTSGRHCGLLLLPNWRECCSAPSLLEPAMLMDIFVLRKNKFVQSHNT